jgi:hypothetical protein
LLHFQLREQDEVVGEALEDDVLAFGSFCMGFEIESSIRDGSAKAPTLTHKG